MHVFKHITIFNPTKTRGINPTHRRIARNLSCTGSWEGAASPLPASYRGSGVRCKVPQRSWEQMHLGVASWDALKTRLLATNVV